MTKLKEIQNWKCQTRPQWKIQQKTKETKAILLENTNKTVVLFCFSKNRARLSHNSYRVVSSSHLTWAAALKPTQTHRSQVGIRLRWHSSLLSLSERENKMLDWWVFLEMKIKNQFPEKPTFSFSWLLENVSPMLQDLQVNTLQSADNQTREQIVYSWPSFS